MTDLYSVQYRQINAWTVEKSAFIHTPTTLRKTFVYYKLKTTPV